MAKKETTTASAKAETKKLTVKKEAKRLTSKEPVKRVGTKKVEKIEAKPEPKKVAAKEVKKIAHKAAPKAVKSPAAVKKAYYDAMSLEDCIANMQRMNVQYHYEDYAQLLTDESDVKQLIKNIREGNHLDALELDYEKDGYDQDLVKVTLDKVKKSMDLTAADFRDLRKKIAAAAMFVMQEDAEKNAEEYLHEFHLCERISMLAKRRRIDALEDMDALLGTDIMAFTDHFMKLAYALLPTWKYEDVVFYEDFMYAYLSLFDVLYEEYEQRIQLDCADLYILHGDRGRGNAGYDYLLRENQIKDYIYYRFAHVYEHIDPDMAKAIAQAALGVVDDRYVYYKDIAEIQNR
ncbi:MAG: neurofilament protein [Erysipelotrichaceae bacterium]|nr:neurofilament protein [Erysipelotrichaceae bacterium]